MGWSWFCLVGRLDEPDKQQLSGSARMWVHSCHAWDGRLLGAPLFKVAHMSRFRFNLEDHSIIAGRGLHECADEMEVWLIAEELAD